MDYALDWLNEECNDLPVSLLADKIIAFVNKREEKLRLNPTIKIMGRCPCREINRPYGGKKWTTSDWLYDILQWRLKDKFTISMTKYLQDGYQMYEIKIRA